MSRKPKYLPAGTFKGKKITFSKTGRVEELRPIANEVMIALFELQPGEYAISDESDLHDFVSFDEDSKEALADLWTKIQEHFGIYRSTVASDNLTEIFAAIARQRDAQ